MSKRRVRQTLQLTGTVQRVGVRPTISLTQRAAAVADLKITFTGGTAGAQVRTTVTVTLNTRIGGTGTAQLLDEAAGSTPIPGTKSANAYVFDNVRFPAPGAAATRVFRITNVRANASGVPVSGTLVPTQILALVSLSGSTPIRLSSAEQAVAVLDRTRGR